MSMPSSETVHWEVCKYVHIYVCIYESSYPKHNHNLVLAIANTFCFGSGTYHVLEKSSSYKYIYMYIYVYKYVHKCIDPYNYIYICFHIPKILNAVSAVSAAVLAIQR